MLLIGQPKSATTSFMWSLSEAMGIAHKNGHNKRDGDQECDGFEQIQIYHKTTVKRKYIYLYKYICKSNILYKEHLLPTKDHIDFINDINKPVIVLIRNPSDTIESYKRVFSVLPEIKIDYEQLELELLCFAETYLREADDNKIYKIIYFEDVINNFTETVKECIIHYGFKIPYNVEKFKLCKRNYTYK